MRLPSSMIWTMVCFGHFPVANAGINHVIAMQPLGRKDVLFD